MRIVAALALFGLVLDAGFVQADDKDDDGWVTIFDGESYKGWKINEQPESWKIEDGAFVAHGQRSHLFYVGDDKPFVNFEFECEVMTEPGSNGGIYFHTKFQEEGWPKQGYESQVNITHGDPQKTGGLYNTVKVLKAPAEDDKWWKHYIKVDGQRVIVKIDGKTVVDYTEPEDKAGPVHLSSGTFAFQAHDPKSVVRFRNVKIKRLP